MNDKARPLAFYPIRILRILSQFQCTILVVLLAGCGGGAAQRRVVRNAESLVERNQLQRAYTQLEEFYKDNPKATEARELQIIILLRINQIDAAIEMYKDLTSKTKLLTFLNDIVRNGDPSVRANACELIARIRPSNSVYLLSRAARDHDVRVRRVAIQRLAAFEGKKVRDTMEGALMDSAWQVRADAAGSLEQLRDPAAAEPLFQTMLDRDEFVRLKTRRAIITIVSDRNLSVYARALRHNNRQVRIAAALALASRHDQSAVGVLFEGLLDRDPSIRVAAARALAMTGDRSTRPVLRESLADANPHVRATAALALAELGDVVSTNRLAGLIQSDPVEGVRLAAAQAYELLSPSRSPLVQMRPQ